MTTWTTDFTRWWAEVCALRRVGADRFEAGPAPSAFPRLYGGQIAAQGMLAGRATADEDREPHSLHATFLRGGDITAPVTYQVERIRESRALSTRLIRAQQGNSVLATLTASFHKPAEGTAASRIRHDTGEDRWTCGVDRKPVTPANSLPSRQDSLAATFGSTPPRTAALVWPVDVRYVDRAPWSDPRSGATSAPRNRFWMRTAGTLPELPCAHTAALTFAADYQMFEPVLFPQEIDWQSVISGRSVYGASLDYALWFHRPPRMDDWLLVTQESPVAENSRGYCRAEIRSADGFLVASVAQEVVFVEPRS